MTAILVGARVTRPFVRRRRREGGGLYAVGQVTDRDRLEPRAWRVFANDLAVIELLEALRVGEPVALTGPFAATPSADGRSVEFRLTAEAVLDVKRRRKSKSAKAKEARQISDQLELAPSAPADGERPFDDALPF